MKEKPKKVALLTSGGDSPGMNAAVRGLVRVGVFHGLEMVGVRRGYQGLLNDEFKSMGPRDVSDIVQRGGTILKTMRCAEFKTKKGLQKAAEILKRREIHGLIIIGGDGSFRGGQELSEFWRGQIIGVPATIDNDLYGTDYTIGFDSALRTALDAIDKIRDTAESHERLFLVEVMGRHSGFIALAVGISAGAEEMLLPEQPVDLKAICRRLQTGRERGKRSSIMIVAEGNDFGGAEKVAEEIKKSSDYETRAVILGHLQRGGAPTAADRLLATKLGARAVEMFLEGETLAMAGETAGRLCSTPLKETWTKKKSLDSNLLKLQEALTL